MSRPATIGCPRCLLTGRSQTTAPVAAERAYRCPLWLTNSEGSAAGSHSAAGTDQDPAARCDTGRLHTLVLPPERPIGYPVRPHREVLPAHVFAVVAPL